MKINPKYSASHFLPRMRSNRSDFRFGASLLSNLPHILSSSSKKCTHFPENSSIHFPSKRKLLFNVSLHFIKHSISDRISGVSY